MLDNVRKRFFWSTCKLDVENWCKKCHTCFSRDGPNKRINGKLQIYNVGLPFERIAIDILGPLPKTINGNRFVLVITDYFSRWPEAIPLPNHQAATVAEALVVHVVSRFGIPLEIHSDQGRDFEALIFKALMNLLGIHKTRTTPLHPQSNGMVERLNRTILNYLAKFIDDNQRVWDKWLPLFLLAYRSSKHQTTEFTPAMLMFGRELRIPLDLLQGKPSADNSSYNNSYPDYVDQLQRKMTDIHQLVRNNCILKSDKMKSRFDLKAHMIHFTPGQKVWFFAPKRIKGKCPKIQKDAEKTYVINSQLNDVVYRIQKFPKGKFKVVHVNRLWPMEAED